jgi:glycosyltransferase involved in cell wall biosynthesis
LKILYPVIDGEITGGNIVCLRLIEEALKRGYEVIVNSPKPGKFTDIVQAKGIKVYSVNIRRSFYLWGAVKLACIIKQEGVDLVHSHTPLAGTVLSRVAGWLAGVPVISHAHIWDFFNRNPWIKRYQFLFNWVSSRFLCARIIAVSESVKIDIIKQGVAADKTSVIYNGIDLTSLSLEKTAAKIREEFGLKPNQPIVGTVARLCKNKGQHVLIKAMREVARNYPDAVVILVGEDLLEGGVYRKKLENLANDLGIKQQIIFAGYRANIIDFMSAFDLFVLPSAFEGLAIVILEAMAARKPVIASLEGGTPEIVVHGQTGNLTTFGDSDALAEAIIYHLKNPAISEKMGEQGYERVRDHFSLTLMVGKIMDIYQELFSEK